MMPCAVSPAGDRFVSTMLGFLDCQAATLGVSGYQALAAPGSGVTAAIGAMLAILIALIGYRLLLGETVSLREGVLTFVRIGIVLAFATSWPAYRTVVYDVTLRAPGELAAQVGGAAGLPGANGGLAGRLDALDQAFRTLAIYGVGVPSREQVAQSGGVAPPLFASFDGFALGAGRIAFLIGSIGAFALIRVGAGLMLALGPLFVAFLLFDATRGLFIGWLRALIALALGGMATAIALGMELALFEPWLADLIAQRAAGLAIPNAATSVLAAAIVFTLVVFALLGLVARVAAGLRWPAVALARPRESDGARSSPDAGSMLPASGRAAATDGRSHAMIVADHLAASQRREERVAGSGRTITIAVGRDDGVRGSAPGMSTPVPIGRSFRRRTKGRVSASATVRDRMA